MKQTLHQKDARELRDSQAELKALHTPKPEVEPRDHLDPWEGELDGTDEAAIREAQTPKPDTVEGVEDVARLIEQRLTHRLQTLTISTKGQTEEYRKGLRDMRHLVMENTAEIARTILLSERAKAEESKKQLVEKVAQALPDIIDRRFPKGCPGGGRGAATLVGCDIIQVIKLE